MKKIFIAFLLLFFIGSTGVNAQFKKCKTDIPADHTGIIMDEDLNPIPFASVSVPETNIGVIADSLGNYSIRIPLFAPVKLEFSAVGYQPVIIDRSAKGYTNHSKVIMVSNDSIYSDVEVVATRTCICRRFIGCRVGGTRCTRVYAVKDTLPVLQEQDAITVFPNPAAKQSFINIRTGAGGSYQLRLMDNNGRIIHTQEFSIGAKNDRFQYKLPLTASAGIHYVVINNRATQKQYTEKLIIY